MKDEADQIMKFREPVSVNIVNGHNLLTSVNGRLIGVQQVHGHILKCSQQQQILNQISVLKNHPTAAATGTLTSNQLVSNNENCVITRTMTSTINQEEHTRIEPSGSKINPNLTNENNSTGTAQSAKSNNSLASNKSHQEHKSKASSSVSKEQNNREEQKRSYKTLRMQSDKRASNSRNVQDETRAPSKLTPDLQNNKNKETIVVRSKQQNEDESGARELSSETDDKESTLANDVVVVRLNNIPRVKLTKLGSKTLKRLGCNTSSPLLLDKEHKEKVKLTARTSKTANDNSVDQITHTLTHLTRHPDSKHIPTTEKVNYLKELLKTQKAQLGM